MRNLFSITFALTAVLIFSCEGKQQKHQHTTAQASLTAGQDTSETYEVVRSEEEWKKLLTDHEYYILREAGTEKPFSNAYWDNKEEGIYYCAACGQPLYSSKTKYKSGTGWPSFWEPIREDVIKGKVDNSLGMTRTETVCARCGSHLGHVFEDGPEPTGLRYCMNSAALHFVKMDLSKIDEDTLKPIEVH